MKPKKLKNIEGRFIIALPLIETDVEEYGRIRKTGGSLATTPAGAVGNYLHRTVPNVARIIQADLRDRYGGTGNYAMRVPENYTDEEGQKLEGADKRTAEEIEICTYLARCYRRRDPRTFLDESRRILGEFERLRTRRH